jgi:hypothetical protein
MADISITAASVAASSAASKVTGVAGATITAGQVVYLDTTTNTYKLADSNLSAAAAKEAGIALDSATAGQPLTIVRSDPSFTLGGTVAAGAVVVLSATAGAIAPVADLATGMYTTVLGVGIGSNKIKLQPIVSGAAVP